MTCIIVSRDPHTDYMFSCFTFAFIIFLFFANHSHILGERRFQNDALYESLDRGVLVKIP